MTTKIISLYEDEENDLPEMKVNVWRIKANNRKQWASVMKDTNNLPKFLKMN
jgi:hypothetical protein